MEGYVALRAIEAVEAIPQSDALALRHDSDGGQPVELVIHRGNTNAGCLNPLHPTSEAQHGRREETSVEKTLSHQARVYTMSHKSQALRSCLESLQRSPDALV